MKALCGLFAGVALGWALPRGWDALAAVVAAALFGIRNLAGANLLRYRLGAPRVKAGEVNAWDVIKHLGETDNKALRLAPMSNVLRVQKVKHGTQVTIGVGEDIIAAITNGAIMGGFLYCDRDVWRETEAKLQAEERQ